MAPLAGLHLQTCLEMAHHQHSPDSQPRRAGARASIYPLQVRDEWFPKPNSRPRRKRRAAPIRSTTACALLVSCHVHSGQ